jgi:predicted dehydrogenase
MHRLVVLEPGHFHAALTLRERHPRVSDEVTVYVAAGPGDGDEGREAGEFLALVEAFNRRPQRPTTWKPVVRAGPDPLARLLAERPGDVVILAGKNDRKMALVRALHAAGLHVLADKPWITRPAAVADVRHVLAGGPRVMEIMTGRHASASRVAERLVRETEIFGEFDTRAGPAIRLASVHHLEKWVNGAPLRRPPWFFDVRVQGDGLADIPTHLVDQAQRFLAGREAVPTEIELRSARRWSTPVPRALFSRVTGLSDFPPDLRDDQRGDALDYAANAELTIRLGGVEAHLATRWKLTEPPGGGDAHHAIVLGTESRVRIEQGPETAFRRRLFVEPRAERSRVGAALARAIVVWQSDYPGLTAVASPDGYEIEVPVGPGSSHEGQFPLVLDEFLRALDGGAWPARRAAETLAKYELIARALASADAAPRP